MTNDLVFICTACGRCSHHPQANVGCPDCLGVMFRVARTSIPLMTQPLRDPYRSQQNRGTGTEDGHDFNRMGDEDDISGSMFGQGARRDLSGHDAVSEIKGDEVDAVNHQLPTDQDAFDISQSDEYPTPSSPALSDDDSPFSPLRDKEPSHVGPHNMPHPHIEAYNGSRADSVYERISKRRKEF